MRNNILMMALFVFLSVAPLVMAADELLSWNDGLAKQSIVDFVQRDWKRVFC